MTTYQILAVGLPQQWQSLFNAYEHAAGFQWIVTSWSNLLQHTPWHGCFIQGRLKTHFTIPLQDLHCDLDQIHAVICGEICPPFHLFDHHHREDQSYIHSSYQALWLSVCQQHPTVFNRPYHTMLSPSFWLLPKQYHIAEKLHLSTPTWFYPQTRQHAHHQYLHQALQFRQHHSNSLFSIAKPQGPLAFCLVIGKKQLWSIPKNIHPQTKKSAPSKHLIHHLVQAFELSIAQLCFCLTSDHTWLFYHLSPLPHWQTLWIDHWRDILSAFEHMIPCPQRTSSAHDIFINQTYRPHILKRPSEY